MKRGWMIVLMVALVFGLSGAANAALTVIGTATYQGNNYKLIHMTGGPFGSITWLDYTRSDDTWQNQVNWASGLGSALMVTLDPGFTSTIDWSTGWRLPEVDESKANLSGGYGYEGPDALGYHDYRHGYNMVNSEMGYLFYEALGNKGYYDTSGNGPQPDWGLKYTGDFDKLRADFYWSGTEYSLVPGFAWYSGYNCGPQDSDYKGINGYALAVRPADVSAVPIPGAVWLLSSGLIGLIGLRKKSRRSLISINLFLLIAIYLAFCSVRNVEANPMGLVSYWQFDECIGSTAYDSQGINNGIIDGAIWSSGLVGGALDFDGIDDIVRLNNISGYGDFTMTAWFKPNIVDKSYAIFQTGMGYMSIINEYSYPKGVHYTIFQNREGGTGSQRDFRYDYSFGDLSNETWHFIAMTAKSDNSQLKAYLDGQYIGNLEYRFTGWNSTLNYTNIGAMKASLPPNNNGSAFFSGLVDEVAQFNRALSEEEINLFYQTGLAGNDLYNPVPIPGAAWLLGSGILSFIGIRRKVKPRDN